jgi:enoyl-CoA hydratase/carnithine racemase
LQRDSVIQAVEEKMKQEYIFSEIADHIAVVTINRPPVNALNSDAYGELFETFYKLSKDDSVRVVVLTGSGEKAFVAGSDVKEFLAFNSETGLAYTKRNNSVREYIRKFSKPIICAVNGLAYGGGLGLALVCDIRIVCEEAKFNLGEINMGILGASQYTARTAHFGTACKLVYSGESIDAQTALRVGIADEVVPRDRLMERCLSLAQKIAAKPPIAVKLAKQCMVTSQEVSLEEGLHFEEESLRLLWSTEDKNEAVKAFLEKRKPVFKGK